MYMMAANVVIYSIVEISLASVAIFSSAMTGIISDSSIDIST